MAEFDLGSVIGPAAGFGEITAEAQSLPADSPPTADVEATGTDLEKNLSFKFGIPKAEFNLDNLSTAQLNALNSGIDEAGVVQIETNKAGLAAEIERAQAAEQANARAAQSAAEAAGGKYTKPSGGIPETDLSNSVQASLTKADNAIPSNTRGQANGVASLDGNGRVPEAQGFLSAHPVGCLYLSNDARSPASLYGGTWIELEQGTFIMAVGAGNSATTTVDNHGNPSGKHTNTIAEMVNHNHSIGLNARLYNASTTGYGYLINGDGIRDTTYNVLYAENNGKYLITYTGGGQAFDIRPPTVSTHIFRRTA